MLIPQSLLANFSEWKFIREVDKTKTWSLKSNAQIIATVEKRKLAKPFNWDEIDLDELVVLLSESKNEQLKQRGINQWKVRKYTWGKSGKARILVIQGNYLNEKNKLIAFEERTLFSGEEVTEILFAHPFETKLDSSFKQGFLDHLREYN